MKISGISSLALAFEGKNHQLPIALGEGGPLIRIVEMDGRLRIMVEVTDDTTHEQMKKIMPHVLIWRTKLLEFQGPWVKGGVNEFLEKWSQYHLRGRYSYKTISERLNMHLANLIQEHLRYREATERGFPELQKRFDNDPYFVIFLGDATVDPYALSNARDLLRIFRLSDETIDVYIHLGIENINEGRPPFLKDEPISKDMVIYILRQWRNSKEHQALRSLKEEEDP